MVSPRNWMMSLPIQGADQRIKRSLKVRRSIGTKRLRERFLADGAGEFESDGANGLERVPAGVEDRDLHDGHAFGLKPFAQTLKQGLFDLLVFRGDAEVFDHPDLLKGH